MGLDNYWRKDEWQTIDQKPTPDLDKRLMGGLLSGHGNGSFRGKVYNDFVKEMSAHTLYKDQCPREVKKIANLLQKTEWDDVKNNFQGRPDSKEEFEAFRDMFVFYAEHDARLEASY
jgi:hypothetical protein